MDIFGKDLQVNDVVVINGTRFKKLPKMLGGNLIDIDFNKTGSPEKIEVIADHIYDVIQRTDIKMVKRLVSGPRQNPVVLTVPEGTVYNV